MRATNRSSGRIDGLDLGLGIGLLIVIPAVGYALMSHFDVAKDSLLEGLPTPNPPLSNAELNERFDYIRRLYEDTALPLAARARATTGVEQHHMISWAENALNAVRFQISDLQSRMAETKSSVPQVDLELSTMRQRVDTEISEVLRLRRL
jgi:hypothetical protein